MAFAPIEGAGSDSMRRKVDAGEFAALIEKPCIQSS
jgi:hypothetical protein